mgnify:CR=1 FL=1
MTTQYTPILKLALPVQGELSGTWGDVVNDNITSMIEQAIAGRLVINTWSSNSHTLTTANGTTAEARAAMLSLTDSNTQLGAAGTVVCPALSKTYIVKNGAGQIITVKTASGSGIAIPNGKTMLVYCDGTNVLEGVDHVVTLSVGTATMDGLTVAGNVDFNGDLDVDGTTNLDVVDIDGAVDMASTLGVAGNVDFNGDLDVDGTTNLDVVDIDGAVDMASTLGVTGVATLASLVATTADINAGTIDGTVIGGATAAAATVTTFTSTGIDDNATSTAITIDASENVSIGTTTVGQFESIDVGLTVDSGNPYSGIAMTDGATTSTLAQGFSTTYLYNQANGSMLFGTNNTERCRITSDGTLLVGTTTADRTADAGAHIDPLGLIDVSRTSNVAARFTRLVDTGSLMLFRQAATQVGTISVSGSATSYNTSSDYRLKEDDVPMTGATERVKALRPVNFAWKSDGSRVDGFFAHEAQEVVPECATGAKDAMVTEEYEVTAEVEEVKDGNGNITTEAVEAVMGTRSVPDMQGIDQSKLVPLLTAALQEAITKIESLEARLSALEV